MQVQHISSHRILFLLIIFSVFRSTTNPFTTISSFPRTITQKMEFWTVSMTLVTVFVLLIIPCPVNNTSKIPLRIRNTYSSRKWFVILFSYFKLQKLEWPKFWIQKPFEKRTRKFSQSSPINHQRKDSHKEPTLPFGYKFFDRINLLGDRIN